jgi:hypothetical protein
LIGDKDGGLPGCDVGRSSIAPLLQTERRFDVWRDTNRPLALRLAMPADWRKHLHAFSLKIQFEGAI